MPPSAIRSTIRQSLGIKSARQAPAITLRATHHQLLIQAATNANAIECRLPSNSPPECIAVPYEALTISEGKQDDPVSFTKRDDTVIVQWTDKGIPQTRSFAAADAVEMPNDPGQFTPIERRFLAAMANAVDTTDTESSRYALNYIRLRGSDWQIAATDSSTHNPKQRTTTVMTTSQPTTSQPTTPRPVEARPAAAANSESDPTPNLLNQAEAVRDSLSKTLADTRDLITLIKRNQKQNRLVETTLRSLKQLEHIGA